MTEDDLKMVEALVQHMGQKIDQIAETVPSPMGQILIEELRASHTRLKNIVFRGHATHELPNTPTAHAHSSYSSSPAPSPAPATSPAPAPSIAAPAATAPHFNPLQAPSPSPPPPPEKASGEKKVLFLIDDDKDAQKVLSYMFERKSSFQVVSHTDPLRAWEEIKANPPDLILMDLMMPGISGLDLLKNIRQIPELKGVKILIGSSKSFDKDRIEVLKAGANDFIAKPYNFTELLLRLNKLAS